MDIYLTNFLIMCGSFILMALLMSKIVDWTKLLLPLTSSHQQLSFPVEHTRIPRENSNPKISRKEIIPIEQKVNWSPVNFVTRRAAVIKLLESLEWTGYSSPTVSMAIVDNTNTISTDDSSPQNSESFLDLGKFEKDGKHHSISFRRGVSNDARSERFIDYVKYPLEMQMNHVQVDIDSTDNTIIYKSKDGINVTIVSFQFQIKDRDNSRVDPIIMNLCQVVEPKSQVHMQPFQLDPLFPTFERKFYSHFDSINQPPVIAVAM